MTVFASGSSYFINSRVQKLKNSAKQNSWLVCRFTVWLPLQPCFAKDTAFFFAKAQNCKKLRFLRYSAFAEFWVQFAGFRLGMFFRLRNRQFVSRIQRKLNSGALAYGLW